MPSGPWVNVTEPRADVAWYRSPSRRSTTSISCSSEGSVSAPSSASMRSARSCTPAVCHRATVTEGRFAATPEAGRAPVRRILIHGVTGSGKTTLARAIGDRAGIPWHSADDELGWLPGWVERPTEEQRAIAAEIAATDAWVLDTAYTRWRDVVVPRVQLIVALDYPRAVSLRRLLRRTARRVVTREAVCNGNRESLRLALSLRVDHPLALPDLREEASPDRGVGARPRRTAVGAAALTRRDRRLAGDVGSGLPLVTDREPRRGRRRPTTVRILAVALSLLLLAACGDDDEVVTSDEPGASQPVPPSTGQRYTATATVLESREHGPQLCLGGVQDSYPPQCGGPDLLGWDWDAVATKESASGTTWGDYTVVGTWDGEALTLTEPPSEPQRPDVEEDRDRFASPCPEPDGGWQVVDPATATDAAMQEAIAYAEAQPSVGGVWIDQSVNPAARSDQVDEERMNDPTRLVLNATFTEDLATHETAMRERWGGALCVSEASASMAELGEIRREVEAELGARLLYSSIDVVAGRLDVGITVEDDLQGRFDERYGSGVVGIDAALRPVGR